MTQGTTSGDFTTTTGSQRGNGPSGVGNAVEFTRSTARGFIKKQLDQGSTQAGERMASTAQNIRTIGQELRQRGQGDAVAQLAESIADYVERAATYLRDSDPETLMRDAQEFGRKQPLAFAAGGLVAGFVVSRLLKLSTVPRYEGEGYR
ncbi:MAG: hypothetical protein JO043_13450 [Candidatus Eremiobacteraeota bacterium]|nr:hypothetical protein [Candidatus Eremiobacteraeota bacterium]